jgi:hypothetical protein
MMQLICMLSLYDIPIPGNVEIYMDEFRKLIFFEILNPDKIIGLIYPGKTLQSLIEGENLKDHNFTGAMESTGVKSTGFLINMAVYIFILCAFLIFLMTIYLLSYVKPIRQKMQKIIRSTLEKTFWNNTIRSITLSYIETAKTLYI